MKYILILILAISLQGCGFLKKRTAPVIPPNTPVKLDPEVLRYCDLLKEEVILTTFEDVLVAYADVAAQYGVCANKQASGVKLLKQFGNTK